MREGSCGSRSTSMRDVGARGSERGSDCIKLFRLWGLDIILSILGGCGKGRVVVIEGL